MRRDGKAKKAKNSENFEGSYSKGFGRPTLASNLIQFSMPASTDNYLGTPSYNFQEIQELCLQRVRNYLLIVLVITMENLEY